MHVLNIHHGQDTGGQGIRIKQAFDRHAPGWTYHAIFTSNPLGYPQDLSVQHAAEQWQLADVVHLRNGYAVARKYERMYGPRPYVIHHHGSIFRENWRRQMGERRRRGGRRWQGGTVLVSTLDLWLLDPKHLEWLPSPYDLDWLRKFRKPVKDNTIRIAHAPTSRRVKSTQELIAAVDRLKAEGHAVELLLIEQVPWQQCLTLKGTADIYFDQVMLGYGGNAIEAWAMGLPVIAGVDYAAAHNIRQRIPDGVLEEMERRFGQLPFYASRPTKVYDAVKALVESPDLRAEYSERGLQHAKQWHDDRKVVAQLQDIYRHAVNMKQAA